MGVLCLGLQVPSLYYIQIHVVGAKNPSISDCNLTNFKTDWLLKLFSFAYSLWIAIYIDDMMIHTMRRGMYCINDSLRNNKPHFLNDIWLRIGAFYNRLASICAMFASYYIIFCAEDVYDMVLNSVAVFFVIELDNMLVTKFDYWKIGVVCRDYIAREEYHAHIEDNAYADSARNWTSEYCLLLVWILTRCMKYIPPFYIGVCS